MDSQSLVAVLPERPPDGVPRLSMGTPMETTFVGRLAETARLVRLLRESRLVTLVGLGGIGKTRLARRVAEEVAAEFPDGLWMVELACLTDPYLLPETVAGDLGVADQSAREQGEVLAEWLSLRTSLLVLDACEHLVDAVASLVDVLLRGAPGLRVLATSRQPLGVSGEHVYLVPPLPVEDAVALLRGRLTRSGNAGPSGNGGGRGPVRSAGEGAGPSGSAGEGASPSGSGGRGATRPGARSVDPSGTRATWCGSARSSNASRWRSRWRPYSCAPARWNSSPGSWRTVTTC